MTLQQLIGRLKGQTPGAVLPRKEGPTHQDMEFAVKPQCHCTDEEYFTRHLYDVAGVYDSKVPTNL